MDDSPTEKQPPTVLASDTENATQVRPSEAPAHKRKKFERLRAYNTGLWNGPKRENKEAMRRQDDLHRYDAVAGNLGLTNHQKERGRRLLDDLDLHKVGTSIDSIIFAVCVLVANNELEDGYRYWPHPQSNQNDPTFKRMADSLDLDWQNQISVIQRVEHRVSL